jgi:hypothetical protein
VAWLGAGLTERVAVLVAAAWGLDDAEQPARTVSSAASAAAAMGAATRRRWRTSMSRRIMSDKVT